jgi:hypothetical protein
MRNHSDCGLNRSHDPPRDIFRHHVLPAVDDEGGDGRKAAPAPFKGHLPRERVTTNLGVNFMIRG